MHTLDGKAFHVAFEIEMLLERKKENEEEEEEREENF